jgi:hypothetical protein
MTTKISSTQLEKIQVVWDKVLSTCVNDVEKSWSVQQRIKIAKESEGIFDKVLEQVGDESIFEDGSDNERRLTIN